VDGATPGTLSTGNLGWPAVVEVPWLDDVELRAWRSLLGAHRRVLQRLDADLLAAQEMSVADYGVLVELSEAGDGRMRMSELAERLLLSPSGLTRRLDTMVAAGLVERLRCPTDRRGAYAVLTAAGRARLEQAAPDHVVQVRRHFVERLSRAQLVALADALEAVSGEGACELPR
jgi:DNA-binding MarR family transcriptional regulator